jgi:hypothetical protein
MAAAINEDCERPPPETIGDVDAPAVASILSRLRPTLSTHGLGDVLSHLVFGQVSQACRYSGGGSGPDRPERSRQRGFSRAVLAMASANIAFNCDLVNSLGCLATGLRVDTTL